MNSAVPLLQSNFALIILLINIDKFIWFMNDTVMFDKNYYCVQYGMEIYLDKTTYMVKGEKHGIVSISIENEEIEWLIVLYI